MPEFVMQTFLKAYQRFINCTQYSNILVASHYLLKITYDSYFYHIVHKHNISFR
ncbi:hypothetical protein L9F63_018639, partial [Diploptera punctata]